ncbi:hypothetical protein ACM64K_08040 [Klebsiella pneumoniae]|uniref:hypothetical protein n=1 Tax=Klebsiella pneumoniae TaxID=573 RepID=UPI0020A37BC4|nr:hypothetical protein [Klebsiella pneumoniae]EIV2297444.1 hypothetical protein [Klebsiella pneumoniae]MCP2553856.1 hypothetical protein [Klebsiella pneumoniae]MCP2571896.1 hypothetical protein [Klebsiella pneumoniae]MCQ0942977.1 hypothetical protein [Klebsiella pneumoniae]MCQ9696050.1 hypothetical protein [Klebsiella pneumoniae]
MRGIKFGLSDTSIQDSTDRVIFPVMDGLAMAAFSTPGGTGKNYSQNRDGALKEHGTVTQNAYSKSFSSIADYIDTGLIDNSDFTALIVSRPEEIISPYVFQPIFGNWNRTTVESGKGVGLGSGIVAGSGGKITLLASSVPNADAGNANATTGKRENRDVFGLGHNGSWRFMAVRITKDESFFKDFTKNVESPSTAMTTGYVKDNRLKTPLLISGGYLESSALATTMPGPENALLIFYRRGLSGDEMESMYEWAKKYCSRRNITI